MMQHTVRAGRLGVLLASLLVVGSAALAEPRNNNQGMKLGMNDLSGYTLVHEGDRDFAVFDATTGIPAQCLRANPVQTGREQLFQRANQGRLRVDSVLFESPGQAASAGRAAALMINNATEKMPDAETIGDASWRTVAGSPAFIVQSGSVLFYIAGDAGASQAELTSVANTLIARATAANASHRASAAQLACDVDVYAGLGLISRNLDTIKSLAQKAGRDADARRSLRQMIRSQTGRGVAREAAVNLLRSLDNL